jgi:hypothetical protein
MSGIRAICNSQAEEWAIEIDVARIKAIERAIELLEDDDNVPTNFHTVGKLFEGHHDAVTLCELLKYLLVKFDGEMSNKGFTLSGSNKFAGDKVQLLISLGFVLP